MPTKHISEEPKAAGTKGGLLFGHNNGMLLNADLASTDANVVKTAVKTRGRTRHISEQTFAERIGGSLDNIAQFDSTYLNGGDTDKATMLAISTATEGRTLNY